MLIRKDIVSKIFIDETQLVALSDVEKLIQSNTCRSNMLPSKLTITAAKSSQDWDAKIKVIDNALKENELKGTNNVKGFISHSVSLSSPGISDNENVTSNDSHYGNVPNEVDVTLTHSKTDHETSKDDKYLELANKYASLPRSQAQVSAFQKDYRSLPRQRQVELKKPQKDSIEMQQFGYNEQLRSYLEGSQPPQHVPSSSNNGMPFNNNQRYIAPYQVANDFPNIKPDHSKPNVFPSEIDSYPIHLLRSDSNPVNDSRYPMKGQGNNMQRNFQPKMRPKSFHADNEASVHTQYGANYDNITIPMHDQTNYRDFLQYQLANDFQNKTADQFAQKEMLSRSRSMDTHYKRPFLRSDSSTSSHTYAHTPYVHTPNVQPPDQSNDIKKRFSHQLLRQANSLQSNNDPTVIRSQSQQSSIDDPTHSFVDNPTQSVNETSALLPSEKNSRSQRRNRRRKKSRGKNSQNANGNVSDGSHNGSINNEDA